MATYTTLAQLKTYLGISGTGDDATLQDAINEAADMIERISNRVFVATKDETRRFDSSRDVWGTVLILDKDLCQITSITNGDADVLTTSEYVTEPRNDTPYWGIRLLSSSGLAWQSNSTTGDTENAIAIVGRWAYALTAPSAIVRLNLLAAAILYKQSENPIAEAVIIEGRDIAIPKDVHAYIDKELNLAGLKKLI